MVTPINEITGPIYIAYNPIYNSGIDCCSCLLFKPYFVVQVLFKTMSVVLLFMNNRTTDLLLERSDALVLFTFGANVGIT